MKIRKAVIPAAGLGTRFLPATKAQPKEMLPIVDKPTIQYIVEEAVASGIESVIIITGRSKRAIEDHFDKSVELELELKAKGNDEMLEMVEEISKLVNVIYTRQKEPLGLGHAILAAKEIVGNEPFAVILGDDIVKNDKSPALKQLIDAYHGCKTTVLGVQRVPKGDVNKYGIVAANQTEGRLHKVHQLVEKPEVEAAPSDMAIMGRYIIMPEIFEMLEKTPKGKGGEIQLTDGLHLLLQQQPMYAYEFDGKRYDVGDKMGFLRATCEFALEREDLKEEFEKYLCELSDGCCRK
ncbi:UTP--glucose-1-phosphate uridylyltransferase GalU [Christensenellaceae bacterium OttesenSCG-928-K19]|nr:UTP--glucose-1-phosphate uridylyltransferase GalU [Christensenellaceae bacterium OttesenSCG-928-K19]